MTEFLLYDIMKDKQSEKTARLQTFKGREKDEQRHQRPHVICPLNNFVPLRTYCPGGRSPCGEDRIGCTNLLWHLSYRHYLHYVRRTDHLGVSAEKTQPKTKS